jgi:protein-tyrosine phosphatase
MSEMKKYKYGDEVLLPGDKRGVVLLSSGGTPSNPGYQIKTETGSVRGFSHMQLQPYDDGNGVAFDHSEVFVEVDDVLSGKKFTLDDKGYKFTKRTCSHWRSRFPLSNGSVVHLSAWADRPFKNAPVTGPDITSGVYLDDVWTKDQRLLSNGRVQRWARTGPEILLVDWPDQGTVPVETLDAACFWALKRIREGGTVDLGCIGGHGRTGTMAAALLVYTGTDPIEAAKQVRREHCKKAIETKGQAELIIDFDNYKRNK